MSYVNPYWFDGGQYDNYGDLATAHMAFRGGAGCLINDDGNVTGMDYHLQNRSQNATGIGSFAPCSDIDWEALPVSVKLSVRYCNEIGYTNYMACFATNILLDMGVVLGAEFVLATENDLHLISNTATFSYPASDTGVLNGILGGMVHDMKTGGIRFSLAPQPISGVVHAADPTGTIAGTIVAAWLDYVYINPDDDDYPVPGVGTWPTMQPKDRKPLRKRQTAPFPPLRKRQDGAR